MASGPERAYILDWAQPTVLPMDLLRADPKMGQWLPSKVNGLIWTKNEELLKANLSQEDLLSEQAILANTLFTYWALRLGAYANSLRKDQPIAGMNVTFSQNPTYMIDAGWQVRRHPRNRLWIVQRSEYEESTLLVDNPNTEKEDSYTLTLKADQLSFPAREHLTRYEAEIKFRPHPQRVMEGFSISKTQRSLIIDLDSLEPETSSS